MSTKTSLVNPHYTDKEKLNAVTTYLMLGSIELTAAVLKISDRTLWNWKKTEWWSTLVNEVKKEDRLIISAKLRKVLDKSWTLLEDRLENGDWFFNQKSGELQRKPVSLRDASKVAFDAATLHDKLDKQDHFVVATDQIEDKLAKLAQAFSDLAAGKKAVLNPEDAVIIENEEPVSALPEERKEELHP